MGNQTVALTTETFDEKIASGIVFVDFWAAWCGPCRTFAPIFEGVAAKNADAVFAKVDTEAEEALGEKFEVESIPTLMAFRDGVQVFRQAGAVPATTLEAIVKRVKAIDMVAFKKSKLATEKSLRGEKPAGVPPDATWDSKDNEWCAGPKDKEGRNHGTWKFWRPDGTLCNECPFVHGKPHGAFKRFHENGEISQDGTFENGQLQGTRRWLATDSSTTERMHENGVSEKVRRTEMDYDHDRVVAIRHFNADGVRCLPSTGEPYPMRPKAVGDAAEFVETENEWRQVSVDADRKRHGLCRFWSPEGTFLWEAEYDHGARSGKWTESTSGEFSDANVVLVKGVNENDQAVGLWSGLDASGKGLFTRDLGIRTVDDELTVSAVFKNIALPAAEWRALAKDLFAAKRNGEALLATARAAASDRSMKSFEEIFRRVPLPRTDESALSIAESAVEHSGEDVSDLANALVRGGDSGLLLRQFAILMDQRACPRAALDFINAAIMLHPEETESLHFTRSLVLISLGLEKHARADAEAILKTSEGSGEYLISYLNALFPTYGFWPANETPESTYDGLPNTPEQPMSAIHATLRKYATRVMTCREAIQKRFAQGAELPWLVPDVSKLLPEGPVELAVRTIEPPKGDDEAEAIEIDESLEVDLLELPDLLRIARADWNALTWLLWTTGLTEIALPKKLNAPKNFGLAAGMAAQRLWRTRDRRVTGRTFKDHQIASFTWNGVDIDELQKPIVGIAEQQYAEMQALFYWLSDKKNQSPWQDNLRGS